MQNQALAKFTILEPTVNCCSACVIDTDDTKVTIHNKGTLTLATLNINLILT